MNPEAPSPLRIAVIGAGFSGLAAALQLQSLAKAANRPLELTVFEGTARAGGLVATERRDGYLIERGADSFITNKPGAVELCRRLGLDERLIGTDPKYRKSFILRNGKPVPTPEGLQLLAPTKWTPFLTTPLLSLAGKVRAALEVAIPRRKVDADESLASFIRRRFGSEMLDRIVQPMVGGIYTSDPERLSMKATLARFLEMEQTHGSVIRALRNQPRGESSGARYGLFATLPGGMDELITAAREAVQSAGHLLLSKTVSEVQRRDDGQRWIVRTGEDNREFDAVILATSAYQAASLIRSTSPKLADALNAIEYASSAIVVSGHTLSDIEHPLDGAGLVIPHIEGRRILAVSFASRKFPGRAPEGRVLLRTFVGGAMQPECFDRSDEEIKAIVREELASILGVRGTPDFCEVVRYERGMPQYHVGHIDRVAAIENAAAALPDLGLCGNAYHGVGLPDAIQSGFDAAEKLWRRVLSDAESRMAATSR